MALITRILLVLVILAGVGTFFAGSKLKQMKTDLQEQIAKKTKESNDLTANLGVEKKARAEAEADVKKKVAALSEAAAEAEKLKSEISTVKAKSKEAEEKLAVVQDELNTKQKEVQKYINSLPEGVTIEQVKGKLEEFKKQFTDLEEETNLLSAQLCKIEVERKKLEDMLLHRKEGKLPAGLSGHVISVNTEWNFVVLDIGLANGIFENATFIVYRDSKLVGKVKVSSAEPNISIADVLPEWTQDAIQEGDTVTF